MGYINVRSPCTPIVYHLEENYEFSEESFRKLRDVLNLWRLQSGTGSASDELAFLERYVCGITIFQPRPSGVIEDETLRASAPEALNLDKCVATLPPLILI